MAFGQVCLQGSQASQKADRSRLKVRQKKPLVSRMPTTEVRGHFKSLMQGYDHPVSHRTQQIR